MGSRGWIIHTDRQASVDMAGPGHSTLGMLKQGGGLGCDAHMRRRSVLSSSQTSSGRTRSTFTSAQLLEVTAGWTLEHARAQSAESLFAISSIVTFFPLLAATILASARQRVTKVCEGKAGREKDTATKEKCSPHQPKGGERARGGLVFTAACCVGCTSDVSAILF